MNYQKIHDQIIERAKTRKLQGYKERHHIIPKCLGGTNDDDNLVDLTAREHFIIHKLLYFIYPDNDKLFFAYRMMALQTSSLTNKRTYLVSSHEFERLRLEHSIRVSKNQKGISLSKQHCENISKSLSNRTIPLDVREKISKTLTGRKLSAETKQKISLARKGIVVSTETRQKLREAALGTNTGPKEKVQCPHCGKIGGKPSMTRFHFDNCKKINIIT